jgi:hypothetical protein
MVMPRGGGAFGVRPLTRIPNSSPSQARFKESTPISRSCDLFSEGPRKCHPRTLGLNELILSFWSRLFLIVDLLFSFGKACPMAFQRLVGPLNGLFIVTVRYCTSIHTSSFYRDYKTWRCVLGSSTYSFVIVALEFYYARALPC